MLTAQNRKLAAILFADIVGYTALMQSNEPKALSALHKFKTELETQVPNHKGEIIQFYGDGCLVVFNSSVDAVTCAKKLQLAFQSDPEVPVRIGLHAGDVVFKEANVFGDAVNIASRIESMGISGAVLLSSNVRNQIKNQPDFDLVSLGKLEFKNVVEGMTVYALQGDNLAVPKQEEIKGKFKKETPKKKKAFWLIPFLLVLGLAGLYQWYQTNNANKFEAAILKERIAVLPFKNNTNNPELDILGDMAADWINQGLMDIGEAEVVSPFTVRTHRDAIGILENDPQGRPSFAELTGAKNLITGNFYQEKDELIFKLEIVDALEGNLRFGLGAIRGKETDKEKLITKLREQIMGYWVARDMVDAKKIKAPKYEAYKKYLSRLGNSVLFEDSRKEIVELDSTFYLPRIFFTHNNRFGVLGDNYPHFKFLERHFSNLTTYEKSWLNATKALYLGDKKESFNSLNELRIKYAKEPLLNHETAAAAYDELNNPELALEIYDIVSFDKIQPKSMGTFYYMRAGNYLQSLLRLNKVEETLTFVKQVKKIDVSNDFLYIQSFFYVAIKSQDNAMITSAYSKLNDSFSKTPIIYLSTCSQLLQSNLLNIDHIAQLKAEMSNNVEKLDLDDVNRFLWNNTFAWLDKNPSALNLDNLSQMPSPFQVVNLFYAGLLYIEEGQQEKVGSIINSLHQFTTPNYSITSAYGPATAYYNIGVLYTLLNEYDLAIENLRKAHSLGFHTKLHGFQYDRHLAPLYDLPEFQELLESIWPEVKD